MSKGISRRTLFGVLAAPAVVCAGHLMPVRSIAHLLYHEPLGIALGDLVWINGLGHIVGRFNEVRTLVGCGPHSLAIAGPKFPGMARTFHVKHSPSPFPIAPTHTVA